MMIFFWDTTIIFWEGKKKKIQNLNKNRPNLIKKLLET